VPDKKYPKMNKKMTPFIALICIFFTNNISSYGQYMLTRTGTSTGPTYYIKTVTIDTAPNPIRIRFTGTLVNSYLHYTTATALNDVANTRVILLGSRFCGTPLGIVRFDTTIYIATRFPFNFKIYLREENCFGNFIEDIDSVTIRYNQILPTDEISQLSAQVSIAPNPNNGTFTIQHEADMQIQTATIYDSRGALIQKVMDVGDKITMPTTASGMYFIRLQTSRGEVIKKVLLE
jgi:hypothetical protein